MDAPDNYYAILGVPPDADADTLKRAYRQLARRYHPDLAGPDGAVEMKRINRAYAILGDPEKRQSYDTVAGGVLDLRRHGFVRQQPRPHTFDPDEDIAFSGLNIFSTRGPLRASTAIHSTLGVISALSSVEHVGGLLIAAGSLDDKGAIWQIDKEMAGAPRAFATDPALTVESLRELRFSGGGSLLAGWGRLGLHVWDAYTGTRLWNLSLQPRAVSAHYSLDTTLQITADGRRFAHIALPLRNDDVRGPRAWGVRGTDVVIHEMNEPAQRLSEPLVCAEEALEKRQFWAIRLRAISQDQKALITLSCAHLSAEEKEIAIVRRWNLTSKALLGNKLRPQIERSIIVGSCADCTPPYQVTPDVRLVAFTYKGQQIRLCDTTTGTYTELASGTMGGSSRLALSPDGEWAAIAREDSEVNEGVIDLWSIRTGQVLQKLYHPWQISALHFANHQLVVGLTDGTIQIWR